MLSHLSLFFVLVLSSCVSTVPRGTGKFTLLHTSNRHGEIEPCGCMVNQVGGLDRMATYFELEKKNGPIFFVDAGDTFFSSNPLNPRRKELESLRALLIARSYKKMGLQYLTPGERDFAAGISFLKKLQEESGAEFLAANLKDTSGQSLFPPYRLTEKGGVTMAVVGIVDETAFSSVEGVKVEPAEAVLAATLKEVRGKAEIVVLLSHLGLNRDRALAPQLGRAVVVGSHSLDILEPAEVVGETWIVQTKNEGQQLSKVTIAPEGIRAQLVELGKEYEEENEIRRDILEYREQVRRLSLSEALRPMDVVKSDVPFVANPSQCRTCHAKQVDFWKSTHHATAYLTLFAKNQHLNPDCIGCHTLGYRDNRGFQLAAKPLIGKKAEVEPLMKKIMGRESSVTEGSRKRYHESLAKKSFEKNYLGVQCEHCHGNRAGHPSPSVVTQKKVSFESCQQCHTPPNAKEISPDLIVKVACPLSGIL